MIYVSSTCSKEKKIGPALHELITYGFKNIELSGGTEYYQGCIDDILEIKEKYDLNLLAHNYFPPPIEPFVLNLASLNDEIYEKSIAQIIDGIKFVEMIGGNKFGFHAGFYVDIMPDELGNRISGRPNNHKQKAFKRFCAGYNIIKNEAGTIDLYLENNAYSKSNYETFGNNIPFMLISAYDYKILHEHLQFKILLDIAHLHVSNKTLCLNFENELEKMITKTDYLHISDNDGFHDLNLEIGPNSQIMKSIKKEHLKGKTITLEINTGLQKVMESYEFLKTFILNNN